MGGGRRVLFYLITAGEEFNKTMVGKGRWETKRRMKRKKQRKDEREDTTGNVRTAVPQRLLSMEKYDLSLF